MSVAIRKGTPTGVSSGYGKGIRILAARSRSVVAALTAVKGCHSLPPSPLPVKEKNKSRKSDFDFLEQMTGIGPA